MRISVQQSVDKAGAAPAREVAPQRTPATRAELRSAIRRALEKSNGGERVPEQQVEVLTAHASLETASGDKMYNFNFAGIKGRSPAGATAVMRTHEVLHGKDVVIKDGFRAYATIDEGARDYVRTMKAQFSGALAPAARGDVSGFAHALKSAHYYTASEADYARGLTSLMNAPGGAASSSSNHSSSSSFGGAPNLSLSSSGLSRVSDVLDAERWFGALPASSSSSSSSSRVHSASDDDDDS